MGRQRTSQDTLSPQEKQVAGEIAAILAGTTVVSNAPLAISLLLLGLVPTFLPSPIRVQISADVARLVDDQIESPRASGAILVAHRGNLAYRAFYAVHAVKRAIEKVGSDEGTIEERLAKWWKEEGTHFQRHLEANEQRNKGAALNQAAADLHGRILSWIHRDIGQTHRASHLAADGKNYDVLDPPRSTDGMLPGMALHCHCVPGPPIPGAGKLN